MSVPADLNAKRTGHRPPEQIREPMQVQVYPCGTRLQCRRKLVRNPQIGERQPVSHVSASRLKLGSNLFLPLLFLLGLVVLKNPTREPVSGCQMTLGFDPRGLKVIEKSLGSNLPMTKN